VGSEEPPRGGEVGKTYAREAKEASASFAYFVPLPRVVALRWCAECVASASSCIVAGRCGGASAPKPLESSAPTRGGGTITAILENAPAIAFSALDGSLENGGGASLLLGDVASALFQRVGFADGARLELEFRAPAAPVASVRAEVGVRVAGAAVPATASAAFAFFDDSISITCPLCAGSAAAPPLLEVSITNFRLSLSVAALDQVQVSFGTLPAASVTALASNATHTRLLIRPPPYTCASCAFEAGSAPVALLISSKSDVSRRASAPYVFWRAPVLVSAALDASGTVLLLTADQPSNRASMTAHHSSCALALAPASLPSLGAAPRCSWRSDAVLSVTLDAGASVMPGDTVTFLPGAVRSKNGLSLPSAASARVDAPPFPVAPSLSVSGTDSVDPCSELVVNARASSPRALAFSWRAIDDDALQIVLSGLTSSTLWLAPGTAELTTPGKTYWVAVRATNFLGAASEEVMFAFTKLTTPAPQLTFSPPSLTVSRSGFVRLRANTFFSKCGGAKESIVFAWSQVAGPSSIPAQFLANNAAQLNFPAASLTAGGTYEILVRISIGGDPTRGSESRYKFTVQYQPLQARIAGGTALLASNALPLLLDASASCDPDDLSGASGALRFAWACSVAFSGVASACRDQHGARLAMNATAVLTVPALALNPSDGSPYEFSVTVSKGDKAPALTSMPVTLVSEPVPSVVLSSPSGSVQGGGEIMVNAQDMLVITAECDTTAAYAIEWSFSPPIDLGGISADQDTLYLPADSALLMPGNSYTVTSSCATKGVVGSAALTLLVNAPPVGIPCAACLLGAVGCSKVGAPVFSTFRLACERWADPDAGLAYQFGFAGTFDGEAREVVFDWNSDAFVDLILPSGIISMKARVRDKYGAATPWMLDTVTISSSSRRRLLALPPAPLLSGSGGSGGGGASGGSVFEGLPHGGGARELLAEGFDWDGAVGILNDARLGGNQGLVNQIASTLLLELEEQQPSDAGVRRGEVLSVVATAARSLEDAAGLTEGYVCETLSVMAVGAKSRAGALSEEALDEVVSLAITLVEAGNSAVASMSGACAAHASELLGRALAAHSVCSEGGRDSTAPGAAAMLKAMNRGLRAVNKMTAAGMVAGQPQVEMKANASSLVVLSAPLREIVGVRKHLSLSGNGGEVGYSLPWSLVEHLAEQLGDAAVQVLFGATSDPPSLGGLEPISQVVHLEILQAGRDVSVSELSSSESINISIPFDFSRLCGGYDRARLVPQCRYFDEDAEAYLPDGCLTIESPEAEGYVTCSCSHLTSFVVTSANATAETSTTTPALTTTSTTTPTATTSTTTPPATTSTTTPAPQETTSTTPAPQTTTSTPPTTPEQTTRTTTPDAPAPTTSTPEPATEHASHPTTTPPETPPAAAKTTVAGAVAEPTAAPAGIAETTPTLAAAAQTTASPAAVQTTVKPAVVATTPAPGVVVVGTTPAPAAVKVETATPTSENFVTIEVGLPLTAAAFTPALQVSFRTAIALAADVDVALVLITGVVETRRRASLLKVSCAIEASSADDAASLATALSSPAALSARLAAQGLPDATVLTAPAAATQKVASPPAQEEGESLDPGQGGGGAIGGAIGGVLFVLLIAAAVWWFRARGKRRLTAGWSPAGSNAVNEPFVTGAQASNNESEDFVVQSFRPTPAVWSGTGSGPQNSSIGNCWRSEPEPSTARGNYSGDNSSTCSLVDDRRSPLETRGFHAVAPISAGLPGSRMSDDLSEMSLSCDPRAPPTLPETPLVSPPAAGSVSTAWGDPETPLLRKQSVGTTAGSVGTMEALPHPRSAGTTVGGIDALPLPPAAQTGVLRTRVSLVPLPPSTRQAGPPAYPPLSAPAPPAPPLEEDLLS